MKITPDLFQACLKCPTKCWLRFTCELPSGNPYAEWVQTENESYRTDSAKRLIANASADECAPPLGSSRREEAHYSAENLKAAKWRFALDLPVHIELRSSRGNEAQTSSPEISQSLLTSAATIETRLHAVERVPSEGRGKPAQFVPIHFVFRNKLTKDDRLLLAFDALVLSQVLGREVIHLMRDLNDAVLDHPYDEDLRRIVTSFASLLTSIVLTIDRRGLKRHFLRKHLTDVGKFYRQLSRTACQSEAALKLKERFEKNRDKLFTFLNHDGVPWNNNNAEHAIKAFARLRRVIEGLSTPKGIEEYLILLSICQTCKYMGVDFLDFLRSGEKDIHAFAESRRRRRHRSPASE
jgi:hypothetical protein